MEYWGCEGFVMRPVNDLNGLTEFLDVVFLLVMYSSLGMVTQRRQSIK